jgi:hypothetical protein
LSELSLCRHFSSLGFHSVAGAAPDLDVVRWALVRVRTASIDRHAHEQPPAGQVDPDVIQQQNEGEQARRHGDSSADRATATWGPVPAKLEP